MRAINKIFILRGMGKEKHKRNYIKSQHSITTLRKLINRSYKIHRIEIIKN